MSFIEAIRSCLSKYATFSGRARRSEYWYFALFTVIVSALAYLLDRIVDPHNDYGLVRAVLGLALLLPSLAVAVRRLHDVGRSGWWILFGFIPIIGTITLFVFSVLNSKPANQWGPDPKQVSVAS